MAVFAAAVDWKHALELYAAVLILTVAVSDFLIS
jgi:hypothetical protein